MAIYLWEFQFFLQRLLEELLYSEKLRSTSEFSATCPTVTSPQYFHASLTTQSRNSQSETRETKTKGIETEWNVLLRARLKLTDLFQMCTINSNHYKLYYAGYETLDTGAVYGSGVWFYKRPRLDRLEYLLAKFDVQQTQGYWIRY